MIPRYYKSFNIKSLDKFSVEYGTINRLKPDVIFISFKTYMAAHSDDDLQDVIEDVLSKSRSKISLILRGSVFDKKFIFDYVLAQDLGASFKNKILTFDLFVKQSDTENILPPNKLHNEILAISNDFAEYINKSLNANGINLSKTKQKRTVNA